MDSDSQRHEPIVSGPAAPEQLGTCAHDGSLHEYTENCIRWRSRPAAPATVCIHCSRPIEIRNGKGRLPAAGACGEAGRSRVVEENAFSFTSYSNRLRMCRLRAHRRPASRAESCPARG